MSVAIFNNNGSFVWADYGLTTGDQVHVWVRGNGGGGGSNGGGGGGGGGCNDALIVCNGDEDPIVVAGIGSAAAGEDGADITIVVDGVTQLTVPGGDQGADGPSGAGGEGGSTGTGIDDNDGGAGNTTQGGGGGAGCTGNGENGGVLLSAGAVGVNGAGSGGQGGPFYVAGGGNGESGHIPGGGGGGGAAGFAGGAGGRGRVVITPEDHPGGTTSSSGCCCCNPQTTGMPDTITLSVSGTNGTLPDDTDVIDCGGGNFYGVDYRTPEPFFEMIQSLVLQLDESSSTGCCWVYRTVGSYEPDCPASSEITDAIEFTSEQHPFPPFSLGEGVGILEYGANQTAAEELEHGDPGCDPSDCCFDEELRHNVDCNAVCPNVYGVDDGTLYVPEPIYGRATLFICANEEEVVTITFTVEFACTAKTYTGESEYFTPTAGAGDCGNGGDAVLTGTYVEGCVAATNGGFSFTQTQDVSGEAGANLWEKIQNATWQNPYSFLQCGFGGGCTGTYTNQQYSCEMSCVCFCNPACWIGGEEVTADECITEGDAMPVDQICYYGDGDMTLSFA